MPFPSPTWIEHITGYIRDEFLSLYAQLEGWLRNEHKADGSHAGITADSVTVTGDVTADDDGVFGGDVIAQDGTNANECGIGTLQQAIGGVNILQGSDPSRTGMLLLGGPTNGIVWLVRAAGSPFDGSTYEARLWSLSHSTSNALLRIGLISGVPTLLDGGTGAAGLNIGHASFGSDSPDEIVSRNGFYERSRTTRLGEWTTPSFSAGDYTASSGSWTVDSADVVTLAYTIIGKTLIVQFDISSTDVSAAAGNLRRAIPGGFTAAKDTRALIQVVDAGTTGTGMARVAAGGTVIEFYKDTAGTAWTITAADNTSVRGQLILEVQ